MQFSRLATAFFFFMSFGLVAMSSPTVGTAAIKRQGSASSSLTSLQNNIAPILASITSLSSSGNATQANITPLIQSLTTQFTSAGSGLATLSPSAKVKRQDAAVAATLAAIITDVTRTVDAVLRVPGVLGLLPGLDFAVNAVLHDVERLLAGVVTLVSVLLLDVVGLLQTVGFALVLASLGL